MNWAEQHIQQIETPKTKTKEYIEWGLKLLLTATGITVAFFALMFLGFESVETKEQQEIEQWCNEYMPELSIRACMDEAGLQAEIMGSALDKQRTRTIHEFLTFLAYLQFEWIAPLESLNDRSQF